MFKNALLDFIVIEVHMLKYLFLYLMFLTHLVRKEFPNIGMNKMYLFYILSYLASSP